MYRPALRSAAASPLSRALPRPSAARRFITTAPPHKTSRSWKNSALRWGAAGGLLYYYNTSHIFADEPAQIKADIAQAIPDSSDDSNKYDTIEALAEKRRAQARAQGQSTEPQGAGAEAGSPESLEQDASQQGAFNEETGEINWDCPCLGGMAHGPCGEQFREAFSCFVYSKEEPKGMECIDKFKDMQNCFREHPDIYGSELDEDEVAAEIDAQNAPQGESAEAGAPAEAGEKPSEIIKDDVRERIEAGRAQAHEKVESVTEQVKEKANEATSQLVPKSHR